MLERARAKSAGDRLGLRATRSRCRSPTSSFDAATVGFGVRNLDDLERGLAELRRVLEPGGRARDPRDHAARGAARARSTASGSTGSSRWPGRCCPGGSAYSYLPASVRRFPAPEGLAKLLDEAGFDEISWRLFAGGIVALHTGTAR